MTAPPPAGWRLNTGSALVILSLIAPVFIPLVTATDLAADLKTAIAGLLVLGIPQVLMVLAVVIVGKAGFAEIKNRVFGTIKDAGGRVLGSVTRFAPAQTVSRTRHRLGLVLFCLPLLLALLGPHLDEIFPVLVRSGWIGPLGNVLLIASFFVLGGDFWGKLRALFIYDARPEGGQPAPGPQAAAR
jgi:hypothetical protein